MYLYQVQNGTLKTGSCAPVQFAELGAADHWPLARF